MTVERLPITSASPAYIIDYYSKMMREFPNYRGPRFSEVDFMTGAGHMKAYVCEQCTKKYDEYWAQQKAK